MTVARNLGFSLRLKGVARGDIERRVAEVAQILGLASLLERYPRQLSGGQRQRVAMGRAIVRSPRAFLFDEPLSNLDAKLRVQMRTEIKALHQRLGATMLYVTHDQVEAMTMADRVAVLRDGRIEQVGAPLDLYDRPANAFVAGFIGSPAMNFMDGRLDLSGRHSVVTDDGLRLPITRAPEDAHGRRVTYGVRPEDFLIVADGGVGGEVQVVEPTGSDTQISVRIGRQDVVASVRDRRPLRPGQHLALAPREGGAHLFDADSGQRIN
jgi:multiple sugar transport system ATP-binding protein